MTKLAIIHGALDQPGGGERVVHTLAQHFDSTIYTGEYSTHNTFDFSNTDIVELGSNSIPSYLVSRDKIDWSQFDLAVFSGNRSQFLQWRKLPIPTIRYCHAPVRTFWAFRDLHFRRASPIGKLERLLVSPAYRRLDYAIAQKHNRIVANSHNIRGQIYRYYGIDAEMVYPPVNVDSFSYERSGNYWLSVNRLVPDKRIHIQIDAFQGTDERLEIVGKTDPQHSEYAERIGEMVDQTENVDYLGAISDRALSKKYANCKAVIYTPNYEDFGIVPVEAMASGKPVLAAAEGGPLETIVHGQTGWLVTPRSQKIRSIITEKRDFTTFRSRCQQRANRFDDDQFTSQFGAIVKDTINSGL